MAHSTIPSSSATSPGVVGFRSLPDLACSNVGGRVLSCTDEFFAEASNMTAPTTPVFVVGKFTDNGKWMDGWESRRKRTPGHDHAVIQLGLPGKIEGVNVDTSYFVGNFPEAASIEACSLEVGAGEVATEEQLRSAEWSELVPVSTLAGGTANYLLASGPARNMRVTHIRFHIYPDGGVARLRVHGTAMPNWAALVEASKKSPLKAVGTNRPIPAGLVDVACVTNGAQVITCNDAFFGSHSNLLLPDRAPTMGDGWETRRKRVLPGHDWIIIKLGRAAAIKLIEIDTNHFKGNYPDSASIEVAYLDEEKNASHRLTAGDWHRPHEQVEWLELLPQTKMEAHAQRYFGAKGSEGDADPAAKLHHTDRVVTHVRMKIYPDGGVSRLRMWGEVQL